MRRYLSSALVLTLMMLSVVVAHAATTPCDLEDGRINARPHRDCGAAVAIYLQGSDIVVLGVDANVGPDPLALRAPANGPIPANANTIVATGTNPVNGAPVILSRLTTGEYQLNTFYPDGTPYIVVWYRGRIDLYHVDPATGQPLDGAQPIIAPDASNPSAGSEAAPPVAHIPSSAGGSSSTSSGTSSGSVSEEPPMISVDAAGSVPLSNCQVTTRRIVRLRTAPDTNSGEIMTRLPYKTSWRATERTADWFRVVYKNTQGWVSAEFLTTVGSCDFQ